MDREAFLKILTPLDVHDTYRELYFRNPAAFAVPVRSWGRVLRAVIMSWRGGKDKAPSGAAHADCACFFGGGVFSAGGLGRGGRDCKRPLLPGFSA